MTKTQQTNASSQQHDNSVPSYQEIAALALKDDTSEATAKGRGRVRCFAALYLAREAGCLANTKLHHVALIKDKAAKSEAYSVTFSTLFDATEGAKASNTMKNKLKVGFDLLAYVVAAEEAAGYKLVKVGKAGDVVRFNESLLDPASEVPVDERNWLSTEGKRGTNIEEVLRAGRKNAQAVGVEYPSGGADESGKGKTDKGLSLIEALDFISGAVQAHAHKGKLGGDLLEAAETAHLVLTEALAGLKQSSKKAA